MHPDGSVVHRLVLAEAYGGLNDGADKTFR